MEVVEEKISEQIKELRAGLGLSRKAFSDHMGIPIRTVEDWEAGRRTPPAYIPRLISYRIKYEQLMAEQEEGSEENNQKEK